MQRSKIVGHIRLTVIVIAVQHSTQREAERQAEHLFQTLLHRAFRGELGDPKGFQNP